MTSPSTSISESRLSGARRRGWRGWFYFGPEAGVHSWLAADLMVLVVASFLTILYVWVDQPGPSDVGKRSLAGLLVGLFGPSRARVGGVALFTGLSFALLGAFIAYVRWVTGPLRERRARRAAAKLGASAKVRH